MSIDIFDVTYCKSVKCSKKASCGRHLTRFKEWFSKQITEVPVASLVALDFSADEASGANKCGVFLDPSEVRV
jgi:hypothetical protein